MNTANINAQNTNFGKPQKFVFLNDYTANGQLFSAAGKTPATHSFAKGATFSGCSSVIFLKVEAMPRIASMALIISSFVASCSSILEVVSYECFVYSSDCFELTAFANLCS